MAFLYNHKPELLLSLSLAYKVLLIRSGSTRTSVSLGANYGNGGEARCAWYYVMLGLNEEALISRIRSADR